jgi:polyhydroxyalkanoate synthesis regulator phasin
MSSRLKPKVIAGTVAGLAVAGGGAAYAATQLGSPQQENQAVLNDAARQLGVEPSALSAALKKALENRVDEAVAAGRLTKAQGNELKQRIESGDVPLFGGPGLGPRSIHHAGAFGGLDAAASYLGLTEAQLRTQLESGKSLADVAKAQGKTVDGLVQALVDAAKKRIDAAVTAGRLTQTQADSILADLKSRVTDSVNGAAPRFGLRHGFREGAPPAAGFSGAGI